MHTPQKKKKTIPTRGIRQGGSKLSLTFTKVINDGASVPKTQQTNLNALTKAIVNNCIAFVWLLVSQEGVIL